LDLKKKIEAREEGY